MDEQSPISLIASLSVPAGSGLPEQLALEAIAQRAFLQTIRMTLPPEPARLPLFHVKINREG